MACFSCLSEFFRHLGACCCSLRRSAEICRSLCLISEGTKRTRSVGGKELDPPGRCRNKLFFILQLGVISLWERGAVPRGWSVVLLQREAALCKAPALHGLPAPGNSGALRLCSVPPAQRNAVSSILQSGYKLFSVSEHTQGGHGKTRFFHWTRISSGSTKRKVYMPDAIFNFFFSPWYFAWYWEENPLEFM